MSLLGLAPLQGMKWELLIHPGADSISRYQVRPAKLALNVCVVNLSLHLGMCSVWLDVWNIIT